MRQDGGAEFISGSLKYWLTFNEINSVLHEPLLSGGILTPKSELSLQDLYQACHHEFVASALATKIGHEIIPEAQIGCMILAMPTYPLTPAPDDTATISCRWRRRLRTACPSWAIRRGAASTS